MFSPMTSLQDLNQAGSVPPQFTLDALQALHNKQYADELGLSDLPGAYQHEQNMRPLQEQRESLLNQTSQAQIPLIQAQAREAVNRADIQYATKDINIEQLRSQYGHTKLTNYLNEISGMGPLMQQAGAMVRAMPVGGNLKARQMLKQAGHDDMWNPAWDNMPPDQVANELERTGYSISSATQKWQQAADIAQRKADAMMNLESFKAQSKYGLQQARLSAMNQMHEATLANQRLLDKPSTEQLATRMEQLANQAQTEGDMEQARMFRQKANTYFAAAQQLGALRGSVGNEAKIDAAALLNRGEFKTVSSARTSADQPVQLNPNVPQNTSKQPKTPDEAKAAGWQLHQDSNGNKAYVAPDGKSYIEVK